jgi:hypothetical protein
VAKTFDSKDIFYNLRISPYIEFILKKYPELDPYAFPVIRFLMDSKITEEWQEPPSIEMCVAMIYDLDVKMTEMLTILKAIRKELK